MKEKPKRDNRTRPIFNRLSFFLLWIILTIAMTDISRPVFSWLADLTTDNIWWLLSSAIVSTAFIAPVEKLLIKLSFGYWIRGWIRASFLSALINVMQFGILLSLRVIIFDVQHLPYFLAIAFISALPQAWVLRRYVQKSWLYAVAAMISSVFPMLLLPYVASSAFGSSILLASTAFMPAIVLLWLFKGTPKEEKVKHAENTSYKRLEDSSSELEDIPEEEYEAKRKRLRFRLKYLFLSWAR